MPFFEAQYLFVQSQNVRAKRIGWRGRYVAAIIDRVDGRSGVAGGKDVVEPQCSEVFANRLRCAAVDCRKSIKILGVRRRCRPEVQKRLNAGHSHGSGGERRNEGNRRLIQILSKALIIPENKSLVLLNRSACSNAKLVALERRGAAYIKEIRSIEGTVADKFIHRAVPLVRARLSSDDDLSPGMLPEFSAVGIAQYVELAY